MFTSGSLQLHYIIQSVVTVSTSYAKCGGLCMGHKHYTRHSSLSLPRSTLQLSASSSTSCPENRFNICGFLLSVIPGPLPVNGALPAPLPPPPPHPTAPRSRRVFVLGFPAQPPSQQGRDRFAVLPKAVLFPPHATQLATRTYLYLPIDGIIFMRHTQPSKF